MHFVTEDGYQAGCLNITHCHQQSYYDQLDDHTPPTYEMTSQFKLLTTPQQ